MKPEVDETAIRIMQQFRARDAMVYDLRGAAGPLGVGGERDGRGARRRKERDR
jgi:hypothetical protein